MITFYAVQIEYGHVNSAAEPVATSPVAANLRGIDSDRGQLITLYAGQIEYGHLNSAANDHSIASFLM